MIPISQSLCSAIIIRLEVLLNNLNEKSCASLPNKNLVPKYACLVLFCLLFRSACLMAWSYLNILLVEHVFCQHALLQNCHKVLGVSSEGAERTGGARAFPCALESSGGPLEQVSLAWWGGGREKSWVAEEDGWTRWCCGQGCVDQAQGRKGIDRTSAQYLNSLSRPDPLAQINMDLCQ